VHHSNVRFDLDRRWRLAAVLYVMAVATLMAIAMADPNHPRIGLFVLDLLLCLPALIVVGPVLYLFVATVWNVTNADSGGSTWPVTVAYVVAVVVVAAANVVVLQRIGRRRASHLIAG
jgi:predicted Co/Zn/Cd cation transporter (cation efflux family)